MVEAIMYAAVGFLFAGLVTLVVIPRVHNRAVRLTSRRLKSELPQSMADIRADKDQLRAQFATSTRRLENEVDQLKNKSAEYLTDLAKEREAAKNLAVERDTQRADIFALKSRIQAITVNSNQVIDQLTNKAARYLAELGTRDVAINQLRSERDTLHAKGSALQARVDAFTVGRSHLEPDQAETVHDKIDGGVDFEVSQNWPNVEVSTVSPASEYGPMPSADGLESVVVSFVPEMATMDDLLRAPTDGQLPNDEQPCGETEPPVPPEGPAAEPAEAQIIVMQTLAPSPPNDQPGENTIASILSKAGAMHEPIVVPIEGPRSSPPGEEPRRRYGVSDLSADLTAADFQPGEFRGSLSGGSSTVVPPIRVPANDAFTHRRRLAAGGALARVLVAVPIAVGVSFAWHYYGAEATRLIQASRISSTSWLQSVSTTDLLQEIKGWADRMVPDRAAQVFAQRVRSNPVSQSGPAPTTGAPSLELVQREIEAVVHDLAAVRQGLDQLTAKPLPADTNIVTQRVAEPHTRQAFSIPRQRRREQLTPAPETRPITLPGWTLLEVAGDAVALRGPNGVWWAKRGDIVPGVGRVESVVQWGNRWIVATSKGLVSTP